MTDKHTELYPIGFISEDAITELVVGQYDSVLIFRDKDVADRNDVALIRMSVALTKLAEKDAEIARKDEEIERLKRIAYSGRGSLSHTIHSPARFADEARKAPEA